MKRLILTLTVLMIVFPMTTLMAHNPRHGREWYPRNDYRSDNYAAIKFGAFIPDEETDYLDNGFAVGGALGHKFNPNLALEVGLDYTSTDFDHDYSYEDIHVETFGIPVTAKLIAPLSDQVELYAGGGFGLYSTYVDFEDGYHDGDPYYDDDSIDDTNLGFHALVGADFKVNPGMAFTMELKYTEIEQDFDDSFDEDLEVGGTTAFAGIKFLF